MNLPNKLTFMRIVLVPFILLFMLPFSLLAPGSAWNVFVGDYGMLIATFLFLIASVTDTMDGQIARKRGIITTMGKFLDPIADKLLVASVLIALVQLGKISAFVAIIIICREFIVTGVRLLAADNNVVIAASNLGKLKTVIQIIAIIAIMIETQLNVMFPQWVLLTYTNWFTAGMMWIAVILTIVSGYDYVKKNMHFIKE
ncbi:MAG: CDP-diacylglycerol--glycerol-3-phosphate 3-phosphatidyltransferase [Saccharofermentanales bacterium]